MALLYGRKIRVEVAGLIIEAPRLTVSVDRQSDDTQAKASITVYNLRETNETAIYERGGPIMVAAGYGERVDTIFSGTVQRVIRERQSMEALVRIQAGDQVHSASKLRGVTCRTYDGPVAVRQIVTDIVRLDLRLFVGPLDAIPAGATRTDWSWSGASDEALKNLLRALSLYFFEDDFFVRIGGGDMAQADAPMVSVHGPTEVIEKPIVTDEGAEVRLFMRPEVQKGSTLTVVDSPTLSGDWRVVALRHNADNWSGPFETWCDLRAA